MKAKDLIKKERPISEIYKMVEQANERGDNKIPMPFFGYVSDATRLQLMADGFKVYLGGFSGLELIIEW